MSTDISSLAMTAAHQNAILREFNFVNGDPGRVRVQSTKRTEELLRLAGIRDTSRFDFYDVKVGRTAQGFLVLASHPEALPEEGADGSPPPLDLQAPTVPPVKPFIEPRELEDPVAGVDMGSGEIVVTYLERASFSDRSENAGVNFNPAPGTQVLIGPKPCTDIGAGRRRFLVADLSDESNITPLPAGEETVRPRMFEVPLDEDCVLEITIRARANRALPAPLEPPDWQPIAVDTRDILAALHAMQSGGVQSYEKPSI